jgi:hypothetical protein
MTSILIPFDAREAIDIKAAAKIAARSESTVRIWCEDKGIARKVAGSAWFVSRVALAMLLDGDLQALAAYRRGERRESTVVAAYFERLGLGELLSEWERGKIISPKSTKSPDAPNSTAVP